MKKILSLLFVALMCSSYTLVEMAPTDILANSQDNLKTNFAALTAGTADTAGTGLDTWQVGDGGNTNKNITAGNDDSTKPYIRYIATQDTWALSHEGNVKPEYFITATRDTGVSNKMETAHSVWSEDSALVFEGAIANASETRVTVDEPTADNLIVLPNTSFSQIKFLATPSGDQGNFAIDSTVTVVFASEIYDLGGDFSSNTFTAPQGGKYIFAGAVGVKSIDTAATAYNVRIQTSNRNYFTDFDWDSGTADLTAIIGFPILAVADMDEGDTALVAVRQNGGTQQADVDAGSTHFSGALLL